MSTFTVSTDVTYAGAPTGVDIILFTNSGVGATATFSNTDFDNVKILDDVEINGSSPAVNRIVVNGGSLDASGWTFNAWAGLDTITINGGAAADTTVGSSQADTINGNDSPDNITGGGGADTLIGGSGNDTFVYNASDEFAAGETIDGGAGTADRLRLDLGGGFIDFSGAGVLANVEKLILDSAGGAIFVSASFGIAAGRINAVTASAGDDIIQIEGADTDLSDVAFNGWAAGSDSILLQGTGENDTLVGSDQDDRFDRSGGTDHFTGGGGNDVFLVNDVSGYVIDGGAGSGDELNVDISGGSVDLSLVSSLTGVERLGFLAVGEGGAIFATGTQIGDGSITTIIGSGFNNFTDALTVSGAAVDLSGVAFVDWTNGTSGAIDTITINGTGGDDQLTGSAKDDKIVGGNGADTLIGGGGDDTFVYNAFGEFTAGETIDGGDGTADTLRLNINSASSTDFSGAGALAGVEKLVFESGGPGIFASASFGDAAGRINAVTGSASFDALEVSGSTTDLSGVAFTSWTTGLDLIRLVGTGGDDTLIGSSEGDQFLTSPGGTDALFGGTGNDKFDLLQTSISLGDSFDGGGGADDLVVAQSSDLNLALVQVTGVERLRFGFFLGGSITANGVQIGSGAITTVDGSINGDALTVSGATVNLTGVTFSSVETITINGAAAANSTLTGSSQVDTINGGGLNDVLNGGAGADVLNGSAGNDTYVLGAESDAVSDSGGSADTITSTIARDLTGFAAIENLTLVGGAAVSGFGNGSGNILDGSLNGAGNLLRGFLGDDTYVIGAGDTVDEATGGGGADTVTSLVSHTLGTDVEKLVLLNVAAALNGTGNALANTITGNNFNNLLAGGLGADTLIGGLGNDTYVLENGADSVSDSGGAADLATSTVSRSLAVGGLTTIEKLTLLGAGAINGTGNNLANIITGNAAANVLTGGLGADQLKGGLGNDTYVLANGADVVVDSGGAADLATSTISRSLLVGGLTVVEKLTLLGAGAINGTGNGLANIITGNAAANVLTGGLGADIINGAAGNDTLVGGVGIDRLTGGANNDAFVFNAALSAANRDIVVDFNHVNDTFRLENAVMAALGGTGALAAAKFFAGAAAHDADDRIIYNAATGVLLFDSNGIAAGGVTQLATLTTKPANVAANDFVVI